MSVQNTFVILMKQCVIFRSCFLQMTTRLFKRSHQQVIKLVTNFKAGTFRNMISQLLRIFDNFSCTRTRDNIFIGQISIEYRNLSPSLSANGANSASHVISAPTNQTHNRYPLTHSALINGSNPYH